MRHRLAGRKLGKKTAHRWAMFGNLAAALIQHGRIRTTVHKAKELRRIAEQLVTIGKKDSLHARRLAFGLVRNRHAVVKLFGTIAPAFKARNGGYTRIYRTENRPGDQAEMAFIEYLQEDLDAMALPQAGAARTAAPAKVKAKKPAKEKNKVAKAGRLAKTGKTEKAAKAKS
jgi:large subunit ribosomal protein L17